MKLKLKQTARLLFILLPTLAVSACDAAPQSMGATDAGAVATVDIGTLLSASPLGTQEAEHLKAVREVLQKGAAVAQEKYPAMDKAQAEKARQADAGALNAEWQAEQVAARRAVLAAVRQAAESVRKEKHYSTVISSELVLASDKHDDITQSVASRLKDVTVTFGQLPSVTVK